MIIGCEVGARRVFASALRWPGWTRSGRSEETAIEALLEYADRYRPVVELAGLDFARYGESASDEIEVIERVEGNATTDFGAPGVAFRWDLEPVDPGELDRAARLLRASWLCFDRAVAQAPVTLRKGPRGGGRDRDAVVAHVLNADVAYGRKLGLSRWKPESASPAEVLERREAEIGVFASASDGEPLSENGWPLRLAARRAAWHILDHAWEIEDKGT